MRRKALVGVALGTVGLIGAAGAGWISYKQARALDDVQMCACGGCSGGGKSKQTLRTAPEATFSRAVAGKPFEGLIHKACSF